MTDIEIDATFAAGRLRLTFRRGRETPHRDSLDPWSVWQRQKVAEEAARRFEMPAGLMRERIDSEAERAIRKHQENGDDPHAFATPALRKRFTDMTNAEAFAIRNADSVRYCHPWNKWLVWDGKRWATDSVGDVMQRAKAAVRALYADAAESEDVGARDALADHARKSESCHRINALLQLARSELPVLPDELDRDPWLLNCANGTLDLRTNELREHDRTEMLTKLCPTRYDPGAECPRWLESLDTVFAGDYDVVEFVRRLFGAALVGEIKDHVLPIFWGSGANGKSTILGTVLDTLGTDYATRAPRELLLHSYHERHPTELAMLAGKRLVVAVETGEGRRLAESLIKELTGGDKITARRMREDFWEFAPSHTLILATNHRPEVRGTDHAIWRRLRLVPFTRCFWDPTDQADAGLPDELRQDTRLAERLAEEREGILAWMAAGCADWQQSGLGWPEAVRNATSEYRESEDRLGGFLAEHCVVGTGFRASAGSLYERYRLWCEQNGDHPITPRVFCSQLLTRGLKRLRDNGSWYLGVGLTPDGDDRDM